MPNSLRKTAITTIFYFPVEEESVYIRKKQRSVNSTGHDLDAIFFVTVAVNFMWKRLKPFMKMTVSGSTGNLPQPCRF